MRIITRWLVFGGLLAMGTARAQTNALPDTPAPLPALTFKKEECIVFLGDSVTEKGQEPQGFVTLVSDAMLKQRPELLIRVVGAGQGWDKLSSVRDRLDTTVLSQQPDKVVVQIGLNDLDPAYSGGQTSKQIFAMGLRDLVWRIRGGGAEPIMTTLTLVGEKPRGTNEYDTLTDAYSQIIREVAKEKRCHLIELREGLLAYVAKHNVQQVAEGFLTEGGGVHLSPRGNLVTANLILEYFGFETYPLDEDAGAP